MQIKQLVKVPLAAAFATIALAAPASAASVDPVLIADNPDCATVGLTTIHKFEPIGQGSAESSGITITATGANFDFTSEVPIGAVIVKGGPDANVYTYASLTFSDTGLHAPLNGTEPYGLSHIEFCAPAPHPAIDVVKDAVASPIAAGSAAQFTMKVTNTGNVELAGYVFTDGDCDAGTIVQTGGDTDTTFGPGEVRTYRCSIATATTDAGPVVNSDACASGTYGETTVEDCDDASVSLTPPSTPSGGGGPGGGSGGGVLPDEVVSGRARMRGPSGCTKTAFRARVSGRQIASVRFFVDGKLVKKFTTTKSRYSIAVKPGRLGFGRHTVVAKVTFLAEAQTSPRTLRLTFRRCAKQAVAPRFTG